MQILTYRFFNTSIIVCIIIILFIDFYVRLILIVNLFLHFRRAKIPSRSRGFLSVQNGGDRTPLQFDSQESNKEEILIISRWRKDRYWLIDLLLVT